MIVAYYRGYVTKLETRRISGGMGAVGLGVDDVAKYLQDGVVIACDNSPNSVTLSGDAEILDAVLDTIKGDNPDKLARRLKVDIAYHSGHVKPLAIRYKELMDSELGGRGFERSGATGTPLFSSVTGQVIRVAESLGPAYWVTNLVSRVGFTAAASTALRECPGRVFVEIGPHSTLSGPLRQISAAAEVECRYISTLVRGSNSLHDILSAYGKLYQNGVSLDWPSIVPSGRVLSNAPRYAWDHTNGSFWYEARVSKESRLREFGHHRLLGLRVPESSDIEPAWRNLLSKVDEPWLEDHKIRSDIVFPFAGYITMAGEAIRQITGIKEGYRVRHAISRSAMVLSDGPLEVVTTLKPLKLTDAAVSSWYEFLVVSHNGSLWTKHCEGQIKPCTETLEPSSRPDTDGLVRQVPSQGWYDAMEKIGIAYGPEFRGLQDIVTSPMENLATAKIESESRDSDPAFIFHPASIDNCLQLLLVSMVKGVGRNFGQLRVPTVIEDLIVRRSAPTMHAAAIGRGMDELFVEAVADGRVALRLKGLQLTPVDDGRDLQREPHEAARLEWLPDFEIVDHAGLFNPPRSIPEETRMQEEMTLLCILETAARVQWLEPCNWHFAKFRAWLDVEISRAKDGTYPILGEEGKAYTKLSSCARHAMIEERYQKLLHISSKGSVTIGIKRIYDNCEALFTGQADTLDTLMRDDILTEIYNAISFSKGDFFKLLAHSRPDLRVLEVGAGTGGTTDMILRNLVRPNGLPAYSIYTFSDISAGFFPQARERFCYAPNMDYRVFDISQNPFDQGFKGNWYDVVLAPNVIHATKSLRETLSNLQLLLRPGGLLVLTELCAVVRTPNYIFGNFSGWWLGEADQRQWEPYVTVDRWDIELKAAGFSGVDTAVRDAEEPFHYCAAIVSTKVEDSGKQKAAAAPPRPKVSILTDNPEGLLAEKLISELHKHGISVGVYGLFDTTLPANQDILSLLDLEASFFENIPRDRLEAFQGILQHHQSGHILWLTVPAQVNCEHPRSAQAIGVARAIRAESQIPLYTLEVKPTEPRLPELVCQVLTKVQRTEDNELLAPDKEYIVDGGIVKTGRYQPFLVHKELEEAISAHETKVDLPKSLHITNPGCLDQLTWMDSALPQLGVGDIVIDTKAVGLNFKDVLFAMGILEPESGQNAPLGLEIAGVVSVIGPGVTGVAIGDRVMAAPPWPSFKTRVTCPAELVQIIPHSLGFCDAATMPICYITVIEALINVGQLEKGQVSRSLQDQVWRRG